jgi:hypothetical protein
MSSWQPTPEVQWLMAWEQRRDTARNRYITASERVHRLYNQGASDGEVRRAEHERDRLGDLWEAVERERADGPIATGEVQHGVDAGALWDAQP